MDYLKILKQAFLMTIHNKFLWIFGFFVGLSGGFSFNINISIPQTKRLSLPKINGLWFAFSNFISQHITWIIMGLSLLLVLVIIFWIIACISQGALIGCVDKIQRKEKTFFLDGWRIGQKNFWRVLGLGVLVSFLILLAILALGVPIFLLFINKMFFKGILLLLVSIIIYIPLALVLAFVGIYGFRYIVLAGQGIKSSIKSSFNLLMDNFWPSIIMGLLLFVFGLGLGIVLFLPLLLLILPFLLLGIASYLISGWIGVAIIGGLGSLLIFAFSLWIGAVFSTFKSCVWTLFFRKLYGLSPS